MSRDLEVMAIANLVQTLTDLIETRPAAVREDVSQTLIARQDDTRSAYNNSMQRGMGGAIRLPDQEGLMPQPDLAQTQAAKFAAALDEQQRRAVAVGRISSPEKSSSSSRGPAAAPLTVVSGE